MRYLLRQYCFCPRAEAEERSQVGVFRLVGKGLPEWLAQPQAIDW